MNTGDLRTRLKEETRHAHVDLEHALDLMNPRLEKSRYIQICQNFLNFHTAFESFLESRRKSNHSPAANLYLENRVKTPWLIEDLKNLGATAGPQTPEVKRIQHHLEEVLPSESHLWGAIYVIEGSTLGGQILKKHFGGAFGLPSDQGARYFSSYEEKAGINWQAFLKELNSLSQTPSETQSSINAANEIFLLLKGLQSHESAQPVSPE